MRKLTAALAIAAASMLVTPFLASAPASAANSRQATCSIRVSPSQQYTGITWAGYLEGSSTQWRITNLYANLKDVGLPIRGDNDVYAAVGHGSTVVTQYTFKRIPNADIPQTHSVYPWLNSPRGQSHVRNFTWVALDNWPQNCSAYSLTW